MEQKRTFPQPIRSTREPLPAREDWERHIKRTVYSALDNAGDSCRILCQEHPDLLDKIAEAIQAFLYDGDVFDQVARTLLEREPEYWGNRIGELDDHVAKAIVGQVLGE